MLDPSTALWGIASPSLHLSRSDFHLSNSCFENFQKKLQDICEKSKIIYVNTFEEFFITFQQGIQKIYVFQRLEFC